MTVMQMFSWKFLMGEGENVFKLFDGGEWKCNQTLHPSGSPPHQNFTLVKFSNKILWQIHPTEIYPGWGLNFKLGRFFWWDEGESSFRSWILLKKRRVRRMPWTPGLLEEMTLDGADEEGDGALICILRCHRADPARSGSLWTCGLLKGSGNKDLWHGLFQIFQPATWWGTEDMFGRSFQGSANKKLAILTQKQL